MIDDLETYFDKYKPDQCLTGTKQLIELVKQLNPKVYVEIGCAHLATFRIYKELLPEDGLAIGIDINKYKEWTKHRSDKHCRLTTITTRHKNFSKNIDKLLSGKRIDVLFIDGDHSYQGVKSDWEALSPYVKPGGLVIFHDYDRVAVVRDDNTEGQGAAMVCLELEKEGYEINTISPSSIGTAYLYKK